jgi:DNA-binding NarL/FixJ family response regulator
MNQRLIPGESVYKIIYAEDHKLLRQMMCTNINNYKEFNVIEEAENGQQLIELIQAGTKAHLVILDLNMPILNGYDAALWLKKNQPGIKILVVTSFENDKVKAEAIRCGADAVISKNTDIKNIYQIMKNLLGGNFESN